jgi:hypothetical protein
MGEADGGHNEGFGLQMMILREDSPIITPDEALRAIDLASGFQRTKKGQAQMILSATGGGLLSQCIHLVTCLCPQTSFPPSLALLRSLLEL